MERALTILSPTAVKATLVSSDSLPWSMRLCRRSSEMKKFIFVTLLLAGACSLSIAQSGPIPSTLFGQTFISLSHYNTGIPIGNLGKQVGGYWGYIEPNAPTGSGCPGTTNCTHTYNWTTLDQFVSKAKANGLYFQWTMDQSPPWAVNNVGCSGSPPQCTGVITDTVDFGVFIDALVSRYNVGSSIGTIKAYETSNEIDYVGSAAQLAAQFKEYVAHIKAINPSALIVGIGAETGDTHYASSCGSSQGCFDAVWAAWKAIDSNAHFDALTFHGYPHGYAPYPEIVITGANGVSQGEPCTNGYAQCLKAAISRNNVTSYSGAPVQIWDTEGSWGTNSLTVQQQVAYIGRSMLLNWAAGVSHQEWYSWDNGQWGCIGCQSADITAYSQVRNWMVGSTMNQLCALVSGSTVVWTCGLTQANGKQALAVWNTSGSSSFTIAAGGWADYRDLGGVTTLIGSGATSVSIGIQPIFLETTASVSTAPAAPTGLSAIVQ